MTDASQRPGPQVHHRYPARTIRAAIFRAISGLAVISVLALAIEFSAAVLAVYALLIVIFLAYCVRTLLRAASTIVSDDGGLRVLGPRPREVGWSELTDVRLSYYTTRRDGEKGWMELTLISPDGTIRMDSDITDFARIARLSQRAAAARGLNLSAVTIRNFEALTDD